MSGTGPLDILRKKIDARREEGSLRILRPSLTSMIDFSSNDYLGLARSAELTSIIDHHFRQYRNSEPVRWNGSGGSRLLSGDQQICHDIEEFLAAFYHAPAALVFNSGYTANLSLLSSLVSRNDTILYDELSHASVRDGIRLSGARAWSWKHNDLNHLEELLIKAEGTKWVYAEAIYSMDGDQPDLTSLADLCDKYGAALLLDEAHSNGVIGEEGKGLAISSEIHERIFARMYTFGKALGVHGAVVCGSPELKQYLINFARPFIYSTALPPYDMIAIQQAAEYAAGRKKEREGLKDLIQFFRQEVQNNGLEKFLLSSDSPIQGVLIPGNENVKRTADLLWKNKIDARPVLSPTVPVNEERIRVVLHAYNTRSEIQKFTEILSRGLIDR